MEDVIRREDGVLGLAPACCGRLLGNGCAEGIVTNHGAEELKVAGNGIVGATLSEVLADGVRDGLKADR